MSLLSRLLLMATVLFFSLSTPGHAQTALPTFSHWLQNLRTEALASGISSHTLDLALKGINRPLARVLELDRNQPEFKQTLQEYVANRVTQTRIAEGQLRLRRYPTWLGRVEKQYGVPREIILALWGIETSYGRHTGNFSVIEVLATLAHDGRRANYFRGELLDALHILEAGHIRPKRMRGSWAGAMGQCQFMPSSYRRYAVDADGDKRSNIWSSVPDVLASAANYLAQSGWDPQQGWGQRVTLPKGFDVSLAGLETRHTLAEWRTRGILAEGIEPQQQTSLILSDGETGQAYLVTDNFRVLRKWNTSNAFAIAVGTLADRIGG